MLSGLERGPPKPLCFLGARTSARIETPDSPGGRYVKGAGHGLTFCPKIPARHPKIRRPWFRVVHHCGEAAPNVSPLGHGRMIPRDGGGVVAVIIVRLGCYHFDGVMRGMKVVTLAVFYDGPPFF